MLATRKTRRWGRACAATRMVASDGCATAPSSPSRKRSKPSKRTEALRHTLAAQNRCFKGTEMDTGSNGFEQRFLILAPIGRDARAAAQLLEAAGVAYVTCRDFEELCCKLIEGAGAALIAEEALIRENCNSLNNWVSRQPPW